MVDHPRGLAGDRAAGRVLAVEDPEGIVSIPRPMLVLEGIRVLFEIAQELRTIGGPALGVPEAVELELVPGHAERREQPRGDGHHLHVSFGAGARNHLDPEGSVLAQPTLLRPPVAKQRLDVIALERRRQIRPVLEIGPDDRRGSLRTKAQRTAAPVLERVHLLVHDITRLAGRPSEQLGALERRHLHVSIPEQGRDPVRRFVHRAKSLRIGRQPVLRASRRREVHRR